MGRRNLLWTIVGVAAALVIVWLLLEFVVRLAFFLVKFLVVGLVALLVFLALRGVFASRSTDR